MRYLISVILVAAAVVYASTCFVCVDETQFVIIKQFGRPVRTVLEPGLQMKWPAPFQTAARLDNRLQVFQDPEPDAPAKEYLTKDKKNIEVTVYTCWKIDHDADAARTFLETVRDARGARISLSDIVKSQLNTQLGAVDFDELVSTDAAHRRWSQIIAGIRDACDARAREAYGIDIVDLRICRLNFPAQNRRFVFDRMRAERERIATQYRSEGEADAMQIRAEARADEQRILSEAFRDAETIRGQADAKATQIYGEAYSQAADFYQFVRTLESYETSFNSGTMLILPAESEYLRLLTNPDTALEKMPAPDVLDKFKAVTNDDATGQREKQTPQG